ncbi:MAG TPA: enoyl-CoA hydratase-related protein [Acidimicrobiales bacterium]
MEHVLVDHPQPHVAVVTLNRPDRLNALSIDLALELDQTLHQVGSENDTWVVVLTGAGRAFCSGLDLKDYGILPGIDGLTVGRIAQRSMRVYSQIVLTMRRIPQPIIAAINGPAYGGGMCLTLAADLRVASESATFNATGIVNGLTSTEMAAGWLLPRLIGASRANDLLLTGRKVDAAEAQELGLVSRLVADDKVLDEALTMATEMCRFSPYGLVMTKSVLWANLEVASLETAIELEDRNQLMLGFTENLQEAIRAFDAGRQPVFTDEPRRDLFDRP